MSLVHFRVLSVCRLVFLIVCTLCFLTRAAEAADGLVTITRIELGIRNLCMVGRQLPARIAVDFPTPVRARLVIESPDPEGAAVRYPGRWIDLPSGPSTLVGHFMIGRMEPLIRILIEAEDGTTLAKSSQLLGDGFRGVALPDDSLPGHTVAQAATMVLCVGSVPGLVDMADSINAEETTTSNGALIHVIELDSPRELPDRTGDLDSVGRVVLSGAFDVTPAQNICLKQWVEQGGHLILSIGSEDQSWKSSPIAEWIPVKMSAGRAVRELSGLEALAGTRSPLVLFRPIELASLSADSATVLVPGPDAPIVVRLSYGFGQITFSSIGFHEPPLTEWESFPLVCRNLTDCEVNEASTNLKDSSRSRIAHVGITDLATQLNAAHEQFDRVDRKSGWTMMSYLLLYVILIGPLDWLVVRKLLNRPQLTWITMPTMIVAVSCWAVWSASRDNGSRLLVNQLNLIDVDETTSSISLRNWTALYSPSSRRYEVDLQPDSDSGLFSDDSSFVNWTSWFGLPEETFGGIYRPGGLTFGQPGYSVSEDRSGFKNLPIAIWSTRKTYSRWMGRTDDPVIESDLRGLLTGQLSGQFYHDFPVPITNWVLAFGNRVYLPDDPLEPGAPFPPGNWEGVSQRELKGYLTETITERIEAEREGAGATFRTVQSAYDPTGEDLDRIMEMLTFHNAAGGGGYTGLSNQTLGRADMSAILKMNRAVLLGRIDTSGVQLKLDKQSVKPDSQSTYVRIQIPVQLTEIPQLD